MAKSFETKKYKRAEEVKTWGEDIACLPYTLRVVMPYSCDGCYQATEDLIDNFTRLFQGTTVYSAEGTWVDSKGTVIKDSNKVIEVYHGCLTPEKEEEAIDYIAEAAEKAHQDYVSLGLGSYVIVPTKRIRWLK